MDAWTIHCLLNRLQEFSDSLDIDFLTRYPVFALIPSIQFMLKERPSRFGLVTQDPHPFLEILPVLRAVHFVRWVF